MKTPPSPDPSRLRQRLRSLHQELGQILPAFFDGGPLFKGSVYETSVRCGKPTCACARDPSRRHSTCMVSWREAGRPYTRVVKQGQRARLDELSASYRRFREARVRWNKIQKEFAAVLKDLEAAREVSYQDAVGEDT